MVTRTGLLPRWVGRSGTTALMGALLSRWLPAVGICVYRSAAGTRSAVTA